MSAAAPMFYFISRFLVPLDVFAIGTFVLVFLTLLHAAVLYGVNRLYERQSEELRQRQRHSLLAAVLFGSVVLLIVSLHVVETFLWASVLYQLDLIPKFRDAFYFCANSYTTLGYGEVLLPPAWRELSPLIAISGLFTFGLTTSALFAVVGDNNQLVRDLVMLRRERKRGLANQIPNQGRSSSKAAASDFRERRSTARSHSRHSVLHAHRRKSFRSRPPGKLPETSV